MSWPFIPTGAIPTPKNNNTDKKSANNPGFKPNSNNVNDSNANFNTDYNNPGYLCKLLLLFEMQFLMLWEVKKNLL